MPIIKKLIIINGMYDFFFWSNTTKPARNIHNQNTRVGIENKKGGKKPSWLAVQDLGYLDLSFYFLSNKQKGVFE